MKTLKELPEYDNYTKLIDQLDPNFLPTIKIIHRTDKPIQDSDNKLGIFSGSFNPLTVAHIKMIDEARHRFQLEEVLLLLAKANVDKDVFGWTLAERLLTIKRYAENRQDISVGISSHGRYIDKITALKTIYPVQTQFCFIVGYDTLVRIFDEKYYTDVEAEINQLFAECRFIVANRDNIDINTIQEFLNQPNVQPYTSSIDCLILPEFYNNISSTEVRRRIEKGEPISHLVPQVILDYLI